MRSALGKGLGALLSQDTVAAVAKPAAVPNAPAGSPLLLPLHQIRANPDQPRKRFSDDALKELANSIREHGVLQPILVSAVSKSGSGAGADQPDSAPAYEIVAGERRFRAAQLAGLSEVPVIVKNLGAAQNFQVALIENIQRADLNPIELAKGYQRLQAEFGMTQEAIAKAVGKDRAVVANALRLLGLAQEIQSAVEDGRISAAHARTLAGLEDPGEQKALFDRLIGEALTVRALEEAVRQKKQVKVGAHQREGQTTVPAEVRAIEEDLQRALSRKVQLQETDRESHKGWVKLEFYSLDDLDTLIQRLKRT